jgi:phospholipid transport system substrate-binding protein
MTFGSPINGRSSQLKNTDVHHRRRSVRLAGLCLPTIFAAGCLLLLPAASRADAPNASSLVEAGRSIDRFETELLSVMKAADTLGYQGRYDRLRPEIARVFDLPTMTRIIVGAAWNGWSDAQRERLIGAFRDFVIATYARRFDGYSGERFVVDAEQPMSGGILVKSRLIRPAEPPVELDYLTHDIGQGPQVIDVFLAGTISELATRRSEFSAVLRRKGYDGLLAALFDKTTD